jgi:hypothetical protein
LAVGDLLVALTGSCSTAARARNHPHNIGEERMTHRVSAEFRRMTENGDPVDAAAPTGPDKKAKMIIIRRAR